jgi:3',5'-cyclic-AMP phosphodiesterase
MMSDTTISVLHLTDLHQTAGGRLLGIDTQETLDVVLDQALRERTPDLILLTGDIAHDPSDAGVYLRMLGLLRQRYGGPWLWTAGNHDYSGPMQDALRALGRPDQDAREVQMGAWAFYMVDTHADGVVGGEVAASERERLVRFLGSCKSAHVLIAGHHPLHEVDTPWLDSDRTANADDLIAIFARDGRIRAYLSGHVHMPSECVREGMYLLTTPSTCFQFEHRSQSFSIDARPPGWRWLSIDDAGSLCTNVQWKSM